MSLRYTQSVFLSPHIPLVLFLAFSILTSRLTIQVPLLILPSHPPLVP
ncbi:hypothetical protein BofuT4_uP090530.1 [Botrytis cinerea T4]|uniref:Uncharacterized protein n=1 Tax=Botryotinia fuckeliana (strain T4) TaxID=999810 RepID=G2YEX3_BOTF4|nr:hypothetical protein BofuT4_uP090530.1 [Botrytis cinerea T4]